MVFDGVAVSGRAVVVIDIAASQTTAARVKPPFEIRNDYAVVVD